MSIHIQTLDRKILASTPVYSWEWDAGTDLFSLRDGDQRLIGRGRQQPFIVTRQTGWNSNASTVSSRIDRDRVSVRYLLKNSGSRRMGVVAERRKVAAGGGMDAQAVVI